VTDSVEVLGEVSVGGMFPSLTGVLVSAQTDVDAMLAGALAMAAQLDIQLPSVDAALAAAAQIIADLKLGGVRLSVNVQAALIADLKARLKVIVKLLGALGSAKAEAFKYHGTAAGFGNACNGEVGGGIMGGLPSDECQALVLVTRYPAFFDDLYGILFA